MHTMVEYFSRRQEPFPDWLAKGDYSLSNFFKSRTTFYPGTGADGHFLKIFNPSHAAHCYFFVDQKYHSERLEDQIGKQPKGYEIIFDKSYSIDDICREITYRHPDAYLPRFPYPPRNDGSAGAFRSINEYFLSAGIYQKPYDSLLAAADSKSVVRLLVYQRNPDHDNTHGAKRFAIFLLGMEATTAYECFYGIIFKGSPPFAILLQDHADSGFSYPGGRLNRAAKESGLPKFLIVADRCRLWKGYTKVPNVRSSRGGMYIHERWLYKIETLE